MVFQVGCKKSGSEVPADRAKVQAVRPKDHHPLEFESASSCGQELRAARDVYCLEAEVSGRPRTRRNEQRRKQGVRLREGLGRFVRNPERPLEKNCALDPA